MPEGYGNIERMYFGLGSVALPVGCGMLSDCHLDRHFSSNAGRSSFRVVVAVVDRRVKTFEGRRYGCWPGRAHRRACATRGCNRICASDGILLTSS